eukprot:m.142959 g.142959  ORF g.142959 m.142959 type:complete len:228 (-) comp17680_c0_seq2:136-819(-)
MIEEDMEIPMKVLIVGNGAVGKSSMIQRYCKGIYTNDYKKTIGVDFLEKKLSLNGEDLRIMIWDTAGQEEFDTITRSYYRGAAACVVAFSTTDLESFNAVESWIAKVEAEVTSIPMVLVQNKVDLIDQAVMSTEDANALAERVKLKFYRTSVQDNFQVDEVFKYLAGVYLQKMKAAEAAAKTKPAATTVNSTEHVSPKTSFQPGIRLDRPAKQRTKGAKKKGCKDCQ